MRACSKLHHTTSGRASFRSHRPLAVRALSSAVTTPHTGKVCVITGANTGLGKEAALVLSQKGFTVVGACRNAERGLQAARDLATAGGAMEIMELDLASLASVRSFAEAFLQRYSRCDVLLNNAGVMAPPERETTADGFELQLGVNHLGHFLLTDLLLPAVLAAPRGRIINVASSAHLFGKLNFSNLQSEGFFGYGARGWQAYGQSKLANIVFTYELHRRLRRAGISRVDTNAVHPGVVDTDLPRNLGMVNFWPILRQIGGVLTPQQGAKGHIMLASDPALEGVSGQYFAATSDGRHEMTRSNAASYDADAAERLWRVSQQLTGATYSALATAAVPAR
jgi:retinol dehydrogenase 12